MDDSAHAFVNTSREVGMISDESFAVLRNMLGECVNEDELQLLTNKNATPVCYVWFVPSPSMHITQGITKTIYVNKMVEAGYTVKILIADWFTQMNHTIGSDLSEIRAISYHNIEVWKAVGMNIDKVEFVWLSDVMNCHLADIWQLGVDVSQNYTLGGIKRCANIKAPCGMSTLYGTTRPGPGDCLPKTLFPWLQCATILFYKDVDIWLLDVVQKEAPILARKCCKDENRGNVPIILLNYMLPSLFDKSKFVARGGPFHAISMEDDEYCVIYKIMDVAFCPPQVAKGNPCLEYIKYIIFPWFGKFEVVQGKGGRTKIFTSMESLAADYKCGTLHSTSVKLALQKAINKILQPVRDHFKNNTCPKDLGNKPRNSIWKQLLNLDGECQALFSGDP